MIRIDEDWGFLIAEEFNKCLDSFKKDSCFSDKGEDYRPSYICSPEPLTQDEEKRWPGCKVICFRVVGYTVGHLIVEETDAHLYTIKEVIIYDREESNVFKLSCKELENVLKTKFEGCILR